MYFLDRLRNWTDGGSESSRGEDIEGWVYILFNSFDNGIDQAGIAEHDAGLHTGGGVVADNGIWNGQVDLRELRSSKVKRVGRTFEARSDRASKIFTL